MPWKIKKHHTIALALGLVTVLVAWLAVYTVPEGHVGVIKRFAKAVEQVGPGLHVKIPFADTVEEIEVRQRKNTEDLAGATENQLPVQARVSINWTVDSQSAMQLFVEYGGLDQFERRILDPKLRSASKAAIAQFPADQLIRNRQAAVEKIRENMVVALEGFPIRIDSPQIENVGLPPAYLEAVQEKERAREDAEREQHRLEQQRLVAQQAVNSANANAEAKRVEADAEAYRVKTEATAEAEAIRLVSEQLAASPRYLELVRAKRWNGTLPTTILGSEAQVLLGLSSPGAGTDRLALPPR